MRCAKCKWKYPDDYLNPLFSTGGGYTKPVCGICALEISNLELGVDRTCFSGEMAEALRLSAIKWRETHPMDKPNV